MYCKHIANICTYVKISEHLLIFPKVTCMCMFINKTNLHTVQTYIIVIKKKSEND